MNIIESLVKIANQLDDAGLFKEASAIDSVINKLAGNVAGLPPIMQAKYNELANKYKGKPIGIGMESYATSGNRDGAMNAAGEKAKQDCGGKSAKGRPTVVLSVEDNKTWYAFAVAFG